jgi:hypothetical protein
MSSGKLRPQLDFTKAARFGALRSVIDSDEETALMAPVISKAKAELVDFETGDFLMAVGDPAIIAACSAILLRRFDSIKMLKWDRILKDYIEVEISL